MPEGPIELPKFALHFSLHGVDAALKPLKIGTVEQDSGDDRNNPDSQSFVHLAFSCTILPLMGTLLQILIR